MATFAYRLDRPVDGPGKYSAARCGERSGAWPCLDGLPRRDSRHNGQDVGSKIRDLADGCGAAEDEPERFEDVNRLTTDWL